MDPRQHLDQIVRPALADLAASPDDLRHAFCAAAAIDALAAHIYWWCRQYAAQHVAGLVGDDAYRGQLRASNRDFELTSDVAKANKHVVLVRGQPSVQSAATATVVKGPGWDEFRWDDFTWDSPPVALFCPTDDAPWKALGVLERALGFLEAEMAAAGVP